LVPTGIDGDCLRFLAMVLLNTQAVERCHEGTLQYLETRLQQLSQRLSMGPQQHAKEEVDAMEAEVAASLEMLETAIRYGALNYDGLRKILKKFDKRTGFGVSPVALESLQRRAFVADAATEGTGRCMALRTALLAMLQHLRSTRT
jgi:SPX domain protein involved in polyphosphate accumulation